MMEIKTVFDFNDFDKIKKYISPNYLFVHLLSILVVLFCVLTNHVIVGFIIGFLGVAIMEGMYLVVSRKNTKILRERFKQSLNGNPKLYDCDHAYNTRCTSYVGLPIGPISNPGKESIEATINYTKHNYYYFVAECKRKTYLSKTSNEHYNTIQRLKNENNWCA